MRFGCPTIKKYLHKIVKIFHFKRQERRNPWILTLCAENVTLFPVEKINRKNPGGKNHKHGALENVSKCRVLLLSLLRRCLERTKNIKKNAWMRKMFTEKGWKGEFSSLISHVFFSDQKVSCHRNLLIDAQNRKFSVRRLRIFLS